MSEMNEKVEEPQEQAADRPPIPPEQLAKILEAHQNWIESAGKEGERANLIGTNLSKANLIGAYLLGANLQGAELNKATGLTPSQVKEAGNWQLAFYSSIDILRKMGLPPDHNEQVQKKLAELEKEKKATGGK